MNDTPPDYGELCWAYPYVHVFVLLHDPHTVKVDQMFAWGDALGVDRDIWACVLTYYAATIDEGDQVPLLCPPWHRWRAGYQAAKTYVATPAADPRAFAAQNGTTFPFLFGGLAYYAYDAMVTKPSFEDEEGLAALLTLLTNL